MSSLILWGLCAPRLSITITCPTDSAGAKKCSTSASKALASVAASLHIDSPIPDRLIEAISVRFLPLFLAFCRRPVPPGSPGAQAIHRDVRPGLVYEHQAPEVEARGQPSPQTPRPLV